MQSDAAIIEKANLEAITSLKPEHENILKYLGWYLLKYFCN